MAFKPTVLHLQEQSSGATADTGRTCLEAGERVLIPSTDCQASLCVCCVLCVCVVRSLGILYEKGSHRGAIHFTLIFCKVVSKILQLVPTLNLVSKVIIFPVRKIQFCLVNSFIHLSFQPFSKYVWIACHRLNTVAGFTQENEN